MLGDETVHHGPLIRGLNSGEVEQRRREFGSNLITPPDRDPWWRLFLEKFDDPVIRILLIAAAIAIGLGIVHGEYLEGLGIITAVLLATSLAFWNEYTAAKEFDILNQVNDEVPIKVVRDGVYASVPRRDLVVGDAVLIEAGEEVPADGILLQAVSLQANEAGLTGEAEPNTKVARDAPDKAAMKATAYPADTVLRSSLVLDGHGTFEVTAVGDGTEIGQTARAAAEKTGEPTPLSRQLDRLSKLIGAVGLLVATGVFTALTVRGVMIGELALTAAQWTVVGVVGLGALVALSRVWLPMVFDGLEMAFGFQVPEGPGGDGKTGGAVRRWLATVAAGGLIVVLGIGTAWLTRRIPASPADWVPAEAVTEFLGYFMIAVTIIVVAVPEGLAMSVTLSLAYSMRKMTAANTLVRKMHACETIGAATVICSDKTGTLTMNEMRVFEADYPALDGRPLSAADDIGALVIENLCVNTTAHLGRTGAKATHVLGNPTEGALLFWLEDHDVDYVPHREEFPIVCQLTFSTERKWMGTLGTSPRDQQPVFHAKGAPEIVLDRCTHVLTPRGREPLSDHQTRIMQRLADFQRRGMRTLGVAFRDGFPATGETNLETLAQNLTWLGFLAIADPVRPEVPPAIEACERAGIQVKMVTGDNPDTAQEIARQIGLWKGNEPPQGHLSGVAFQELDEARVAAAARELKILSRAKPLDKVRLVRSLQAAGEVVAVTGDGINDCGALNYANVGLAMGRTGKDAAKEASDIVLLDDSFRTIVNAVMWGRSLYENIQRFILFQLTINVTALMIALLGPFLGVKLPLTVIQMLWVNLIMDTLAALALATEPPHRDVLNRPPRSPKDFIVTRPMAVRIFGMAGLFLLALIAMLLYVQADGQVTPYELSVFFTVFVLLQFWNLFNVRCLGRNRSALAGILENKSFVVIAATILAGQVAIVQLGGGMFRTVPLDWQHWLLILIATSAVLWMGELGRWWARRQAAVRG
jgi:P-type Ca2+ transporter type 2C